VAVAAYACAVVVGAQIAARADSFVNFESGQVRPLALSPDGNHLYALNTPDNRVEVFALGTASLTPVGEVEVGLEPVAVAARSSSEIWVVNHLSDSVSIVDVSDPTRPHVTATLNVGDEPRDVVFARTDNSRAYVTCAHRGQMLPAGHPGPQLTTEGVARSDVWVFNATSLGTTPTVLMLFGDSPRALAVKPDGSKVYAAVFESGSQTTTINETVVSNNGGLPPMPSGSTANPPDTGLIVKFNNATQKWEDERGAAVKDWTSLVRFSLPDNDVFPIDATTDPPTVPSPDVNGLQGFQHVGTVLFNMAVNPANGHVYVSNTDARNQIRFEPFLSATQGVRGHIAESRITIIDPTSGTVTPRHLNPHVNYACEPPSCTPDPSEIPLSLAFPLGMVFNSSGSALYVAAFGSGKVARLDTAALESSGAINAVRIPVGGGPTGLALDETRSQLYVLNRFDESISIVDTTTNTTVGNAVPLKYDPSPAVIKSGRHFLYDATFSAHGDTACASCHVFGDFDGLAWDLGDPFGTVTTDFGPRPPTNSGIAYFTQNFHPIKGPMTTQSLRGLNGVGPLHWRGDRNGGAADPGNSQASFGAFNVAFPGLLGAASQLSAQDMQAFTDFALTIHYPPNPIANLDDTPTTAQGLGQTAFTSVTVDTHFCVDCHAPPLTTGGFRAFVAEPQEFKVAHLRNLYQKIGMFGTAAALSASGTPDANLGPQVRGFGFLHDGSDPTVFNFLHSPEFLLNNVQRSNLEQFVLATSTGLAPIVGQQVTATSSNFSSTAVVNRVALMTARDDAGDCDLVVKGIFGGIPRGWLYNGAGQFQSDRLNDPLVDEQDLRGQAATLGQELTYTCVPPGSGIRIALDRDEDGFFDQDEIDSGSNPADPTDVPAVPITGSLLTLGGDSVAPINLNARRIIFKSLPFKGSASGVVLPASGSRSDPTSSGVAAGGGGGSLVVYNAAGTGEKVQVALPVTSWTKRTGAHLTVTEYKYADPKRASGPISLISVKAGKLLLKGSGAGWTYQLDNPPQGKVAVRLQLGAGPSFCAVFPAKTTGNPPSSAQNDKLDKFIGAANSPAPSPCPPVP